VPLGVHVRQGLIQLLVGLDAATVPHAGRAPIPRQATVTNRLSRSCGYAGGGALAGCPPSGFRMGLGVPA
jgi:hypothetical protein